MNCNVYVIQGSLWEFQNLINMYKNMQKQNRPIKSMKCLCPVLLL